MTSSRTSLTEAGPERRSAFVLDVGVLTYQEWMVLDDLELPRLRCTLDPAPPTDTAAGARPGHPLGPLDDT